MYKCIHVYDFIREKLSQMSRVQLLEQKGADTAAIRLLFDKDLKVLVDDCHR